MTTIRSFSFDVGNYKQVMLQYKEKKAIRSINLLILTGINYLNVNDFVKSLF